MYDGTGIEGFGKLLLVIGFGIALIGGLLWALGRIFPAFGNLPGDIRYESDNISCMVPITSMLLLSLIGSILLTVLVNLLGRFLGR